MNQQEPPKIDGNMEMEPEDKRNSTDTSDECTATTITEKIHEDSNIEEQDGLELFKIVQVLYRDLSSLSNDTVKFPLLSDFETATNPNQWLRTLSFESSNTEIKVDINQSASSAAAASQAAGAAEHNNIEEPPLPSPVPHDHEMPTNITTSSGLPPELCSNHPNQEIVLGLHDDSETSSYCTPISSTAPAVYMNINPEGSVMVHTISEGTLKPPAKVILLDDCLQSTEHLKVKHNRIRRSAVVGLILVFILMVLTTYFVIQRKKQESIHAPFSSSSTNVTTPTTTTTPSSSASTSPPQQVGSDDNSMSRVLSLLPQDTIIQLDDPLSCQSRAFDWIVNDPTLPDTTDWRIVQRFALATLYYATAGTTHWISNQHWLSYEIHDCEWFTQALTDDENDENTVRSTTYNTTVETPFLCKSYDIDNHADSVNERVTHINLKRNGLDGTIPPELYLLTDLELVNLAANRLHGPLFLPQIRQLSHLAHLDISSNQLTSSSTLPTELGLLTQLSHLVLFNISLTGTIPSQLGLATLLSKLDVHTNQLTGNIPAELAGLTNLDYLDIGDNALTSTVPEQFGHWATQRTEDSRGDSLTRFNVSLNDLSGTLPSSLCSLMNAPSSSLVLSFDCSYKLCGCYCICT